MELSAADFGCDFKWGVASAAYQVEGAYLKHGKGLSIWDEFTVRPGKIYRSQNANVTCDFYHNYHQDIALMSALHIPNFRFSISWSRIFPEGTGTPNKAGIDFYKRIIDFCLELDIEPWITLYHWDLPLELEKKGGWTNRDVIGWFCDYVQYCVSQLGDKVKNWMVLNEPMAFTGAGYFLGIHAPGRKSLKGFLSAVHHAVLSQAEGARVIRSVQPGANIGTTFSFSDIQPASQNSEDINAAARIDALLNRTMIEPLLGLNYPVQDLPVLLRIEDHIKDGDEARMQFAMDFIGAQVYTREIVGHSYVTPFVQARVIKADARNVNRTEMNWEIYPESLYNVLKKVSSYHISNIIVTENGAAFDDVVENGQVNDKCRAKYLQDHIHQVLRAKQEGVPVNGYFVWTFTDNFEWREGYRARFGLVHVDFSSQKRIVKSSGLWYARFLAERLSEPSKETSQRENITSGQVNFY